MATTTHAAQSYSGRKFHISRKDGQINKDGEPFFFERIDTIPADPGKRLFETRSGSEDPRHYELFKAISGHLVGLAIEETTIADKTEKHLIVYLQDGAEDYRIGLGKPEERYAMDFMKRILHKNFEPSAKLSLSPFAIKDKDGRTNIGVSVYSGANKLTGTKEDAHLQGIAQPQTFVNPKTDKTEYNWKPVAAWLWLQIRDFVLPVIKSDPISVPAAKPAQPAAPANQPTRQTAAPALDHNFPTQDVTYYSDGDDPDLPF